MSTPLPPIADLFTAYEEAIQAQVSTICRRYNTETHYDDFLGIANVTFVRVYQAYTKDAADFLTYLKRAISNQCIDEIRSRTLVRKGGRAEICRLSAIDPNDELVEDRNALPPNGFVTDLYDTVSEDAREILNIIFGKGDDVPTSVARIIVYFKNKNWTRRRTTAAIREIQRHVNA